MSKPTFNPRQRYLNLLARVGRAMTPNEIATYAGNPLLKAKDRNAVLESLVADGSIERTSIPNPNGFTRDAQPTVVAYQIANEKAGM